MKDPVKHVFKKILRLSPPPQSGKSATLDIGCASGNLVHAFDQHGYAAAGFDPAADFVEQAKVNGLSCYEGNFPSQIPAEIEGRKYSIITIFECIYYLDNFNAIYTWVREHLLDGGYFVIKSLNGRSPNIHSENFFARVGDNAKSLPQKSTLEFFARRNGLEVVEAGNIPDFIFVDKLGIPYRGKGRLLSIAAYLTSKIVNYVWRFRRADRCFVILKKIG